MKKADLSKFDPNGAGDASAGIFGLGFDADESNVILIPVPWEATTSYGRGTSKGPKAILNASPQLDLFDAELATLGLNRPWEFGIFMEKEDAAIRRMNADACKNALPIVKKGGNIEGNRTLMRALENVNAMSAQLNEFVYARAKHWLGLGKIAGVVGGDHSVSLGIIKAAAEQAGEIGILHIDAHADLRDAYEGFRYSHASIMHNVLAEVPGVRKIVQVGIRDFCDSEHDRTQSDPRLKTHFDFALKDALHNGKTWQALCDDIVGALPQNVYVSFDIDGLNPALCPGTGTPVPGGLEYAQALALLKTIHLHKKRIVAFDLNEVSPSGRPGDEWDGNVGARILYKMCGLSLLSAGAQS